MTNQCVDAFKNTPATRDLREQDRIRILEEMAPLRRFLGSPGDWGYGSQLAELTLILDEVRSALTSVQREVEK